MDVNTTIDRFVIEFSAFENQGLRSALRSLTDDPSLVDRAEAQLNIQARLTLLKRVAYVRRVDIRLAGRLEHIAHRAPRLAETRDLLSGDASPVRSGQSNVSGVPTIAQLDSYRREVDEYQSLLQLLVQHSADVRHSHS